LQQEVHRIDRDRGTTLVLTIDRGLQARDHVKVETAFREVFAILLDDLLISIQQRLAQSVTVGRALQHARRFYGEGLDAYLSINAPKEAARASFALDAMTRAVEELKAGKSFARDWFARERGNFMQAINEGLGARVGRQARSATAENSAS
jgi:LPS sulfotransferase NodH